MVKAPIEIQPDQRCGWRGGRRCGGDVDARELRPDGAHEQERDQHAQEVDEGHEVQRRVERTLLVPAAARAQVHSTSHVVAPCEEVPN